MPSEDSSKVLAPDLRYWTLIAGMAVLILIALAGLWILERGRRARAERELAEYRSLQQKTETLRDLLGADTPSGFPAIKLDREALRRNAIEAGIDAPDVLLLSADEAALLGLEPGDRLRVPRPGVPDGVGENAVEAPSDSTGSR
jgi:protein involved in polysaccharide export with SLBB domain